MCVLITRSHEELDIAEGGVAVDQVDPLELDAQLAVYNARVEIARATASPELMK